jgi:hypothetical protein
MSDVRDIIRKKASNVQSKWRHIFTGDEKKRIRDHLREREDQPNYIKLVDKVGFTFGVLNILACQYFLLNVPEYFSVWFCGIVPIILLSRLYHFHSLNWHYFLIDFCYFVNIGALFNLLVFKSSLLVFKVCFIHSVGTLPLAIIIWRNSLVFHDYDKIVSVYIHLLPCMLYYTLRWRSPQFFLPDSNYERKEEMSHSLALFDYFCALVFYLGWQVLYIVKTEYLDKEKFVQNPDLLTSLRWMSKDTKNPLAKKILGLLRKIGIFGKDESYDSTSMKTKLVFVFAQFVVTLISLLPSYFIYNSAGFHLFYIGLVFTISVFNGANFYIEIFSVRYQPRLEKLAKMHEVALEANSVIKQIENLQEDNNKEKTNIPPPSAKESKEKKELKVRSRSMTAVPEDMAVRHHHHHHKENTKSMEELSAALEETSIQALKQLHKEKLQIINDYSSSIPDNFVNEALETYLLNIDDEEDSKAMVNEYDQKNKNSMDSVDNTTITSSSSSVTTLSPEHPIEVENDNDYKGSPMSASDLTSPEDEKYVKIKKEDAAVSAAAELNKKEV